MLLPGSGFGYHVVTSRCDRCNILLQTAQSKDPLSLLCHMMRSQNNHLVFLLFDGTHGLSNAHLVLFQSFVGLFEDDGRRFDLKT